MPDHIVIGSSIRRLQYTESTNSLLKAEAEAGLVREGAVVCAEHQTAGKGRLERTWEAPPGKSLLFSTMLYPEIPPDKLSLTGLMTSLVVMDGLREYLAKQDHDYDQIYNQFRMKWPNDILFNNRKICGILCESGVNPAGKRFVIIGIGFNVNQSAEDFPHYLQNSATSLYLITGATQQRDTLLGLILKSLEAYYMKIRTQGYSWIPTTWLEKSGITGSQLVIRQETTIRGTCIGLEDDGALKLLLKTGEQITIYSGDVS